MIFIHCYNWRGEKALVDVFARPAGSKNRRIGRWCGQLIYTRTEWRSFMAQMRGSKNHLFVSDTQGVPIFSPKPSSQRRQA
jgi:hypothetical protein